MNCLREISLQIKTFALSRQRMSLYRVNHISGTAAFHLPRRSFTVFIPSRSVRLRLRVGGAFPCEGVVPSEYTKLHLAHVATDRTGRMSSPPELFFFAQSCTSCVYS